MARRTRREAISRIGPGRSTARTPESGGGSGERRATNLVYQRLWQTSQESLAQQGELAQAQIGLSADQVALMEDQWRLYKDTYAGTEKKWANAARAGIPTDYYVARAGQDVNQAFDGTRQKYAKELQRMGIDPSSPRFAAILADVDIAQAAALAGAKTRTRTAINDANYARLGEVGKTGRGIPSEASSMLSAASGALGQASNAYQAGYGDVNSALSALGNVALGREQAYNQTQLQQSANSAARTTSMYGAIGTIGGTAAGVATGRMIG